MSAFSMLTLAMPKDEKIFKELVIEYVKGTYKATDDDIDITDEPEPGFTVMVIPKKENPEADGEKLSDEKSKENSTGKSKSKDNKQGDLKSKDKEPEGPDRCVLVQCMNCSKISIDKRLIDAWILDNDEEDEPLFSELVLVIADFRDETLAEYVKKVSELRKEYGEFEVSVIFWDDIESFVRRNYGLMRKYYLVFVKTENDINNLKMTKRKSYDVHDEATLKSICLDEMEGYGVLRLLQIDPGIGFTVRLLIAADYFTASMQRLSEDAVDMAKYSEIYRRMVSFYIAVNRFATRMAVFCELNLDNKVVRVIPSYRNAEVADKLGELKAEVMDRMNELFLSWSKI
ncbi:MAG: hypothetical protein IJ224_04615 [Lachnospiraceae bacterium]|nr:hypothetical protein [Lachnospiraceae bacterium]